MEKMKPLSRLDIVEQAKVESMAFVHWAIHQEDFSPWMERFTQAVGSTCPCGRDGENCDLEVYRRMLDDN
jgi:hypothetical protein